MATHDFDAFEEDMDHGGARFGRRVVLHPRHPVEPQDLFRTGLPNMSMRGNRFAALGTETVAMPASGHSAARVPPDVLDALGPRQVPEWSS